jgi:hypothetical protein
MATKLYTIENLLVGQTYRSRTRHFEGEIVSYKDTVCKLERCKLGIFDLSKDFLNKNQ